MLTLKHLRGLSYDQTILDVEFGRKVWLDEVDGGIISNYRILDGDPHDTQQLVASLDRHLENFGVPPKLVSSDRAFLDNLAGGGYPSLYHFSYARYKKIERCCLESFAPGTSLKSRT